MNTKLHLLMSTGKTAQRHMMAAFAPGDQVLLVDQGTGLVTWPERLQALQEIAGEALAVARADLDARGLLRTGQDRGLRIVDDQEWVAAVTAHRHVLSWT